MQLSFSFRLGRNGCDFGGLSCRAGLLEHGMDWRTAMLRTDTTRDTREDEAAYAAGWTISGLATLGTIIAVWMFAI